MNLDWDCASDNIVNSEIIARLKKFKDIIVFGAGESGEWAVEQLNAHQVYPICFCDNSPRKWGHWKKGLKIERFEDAVALYPEAAFCVASMWSEDIFRQIGAYDASILNRTWNLLTTMAWETTNLSSKSSEKAYILENLEAFELLHTNLADAASKDTLEGLLNYRLTRNSRYLERIKSTQQIYFDTDIISPALREKIVSGTIVDGGAFDGDTVETILDLYGSDRILDISCYEISKDNIDVILGKKDCWKPHKIHVHPTALDKTSGKAQSTTKGYGSKTVHTERIDDGGYANVSMIKLDIEGAERAALLGARETIERCQPVLAICAYHLQDDLLVLSDIIRSFRCNYLLYLRHYMLSSGDSILYAIPSET